MGITAGPIDLDPLMNSGVGFGALAFVVGAPLPGGAAWGTVGRIVPCMTDGPGDLNPLMNCCGGGAVVCVGGVVADSGKRVGSMIVLLPPMNEGACASAWTFTGGVGVSVPDSTDVCPVNVFVPDKKSGGVGVVVCPFPVGGCNTTALAATSDFDPAMNIRCS